MVHDSRSPFPLLPLLVGGAASGAGAGGAGIVSAAQAEQLFGLARAAEDTVKAARQRKKDAESNVKRLHARAKELQVRLYDRK